MTKIKKLIRPKKLIISISIFALAIASFPIANTSAATITGRKITIGSSAASASTTYTFTSSALPTTGTAVKSVSIDICDTAVGTCTNTGSSAGFSASSAALASQPTGLGSASGWTVTSATQYSLHVSNSANSTNPSGAVSIAWNTVTNPSATNSTFYARVTTYSTGTYTSAIDTGVVALSTAGQITVTAAVNETLSFTLSSATVALGTLSTSSTGSGTSSMTASTNASTGYSITVSGNTLTDGSNNIDALASATASSTNNEQFGINLMSNSTPSVGTAVSGSGSGAPATGYSTANQFKFVSGDTIASAGAPTNSNTFTVSYIANISGVTAPGAYQTVLTYVATANF